MEHLWTWDGIYFGYREEDDLWTHEGDHVGRFEGDEVYGPDGEYLGEIMQDQLITDLNKKDKRGSGFCPYASRVGIVPYTDYVGHVMLSGYEDFSI